MNMELRLNERQRENYVTEKSEDIRNGMRRKIEGKVIHPLIERPEIANPNCPLGLKSTSHKMVWFL